jgi:O-antigen/teichoic acid export membrane protein
VELGRAAVALLATVTLVDKGAGSLGSVAASLLLGDIAAALIGLVVLRPRRSLGLSVRRPSRAAFSDLWRSSRPLLAASGLSLGWTKTDAVIVGVGLGPGALTTYGVVVRVYELLRSGLEVIFVGLVPSTARYLDGGDRVGIARLHSRAVAYGALLIWPFAVTVTVFTPDLLRLWLHGGHFPGIHRAMAIAMALIVITTPAMSANFVLAGVDRIAPAVRAMLWVAPINLAVSIALLRSLDVSAVFVGTLVGTMLLVPRYLAIVAGAIDVDRSDLVGDLRRPVTLLAALTAALVAIRLAGLSDVTTAAGVAVLGLGYAAGALRWVVPPQDLRRLLP